MHACVAKRACVARYATPSPPPLSLPRACKHTCVAHYATGAVLCNRRLSPSRDLPQCSMHGLCYAMRCCACSHCLAWGPSVLSLMTAIFGGSIKTLAGSSLFTSEGCAVVTNGRVPSQGSNRITTLSTLISFDQNDYPKQTRGLEDGRTTRPCGPIECFRICGNVPCVCSVPQ